MIITSLCWCFIVGVALKIQCRACSLSQVLCEVCEAEQGCEPCYAYRLYLKHSDILNFGLIFILMYAKHYWNPLVPTFSKYWIFSSQRSFMTYIYVFRYFAFITQTFLECWTCLMCKICLPFTSYFNCFSTRINTLRPSDAYMRQYTIPTLLRIMGGHLTRPQFVNLNYHRLD